MFKRIITEETQMSRSAARCYSDVNRYDPSKDAFFSGQAVNIWFFGSFKGCGIRKLRVGDIPHTIKNEENELVIVI